MIEDIKIQKCTTSLTLVGQGMSKSSLQNDSDVISNKQSILSSALISAALSLPACLHSRKQIKIILIQFDN